MIDDLQKILWDKDIKQIKRKEEIILCLILYNEVNQTNI